MRNRTAGTLSTIALALASCFCAHVARAAEDEASTYIHTDTACPSAAAIWRTLQRMVSADELALAQSRLKAPWAVVHDQGAGYEVRFGDERRRYPGAARDCQKRAQIAAVFIALKLDPTRFEVEPTPAPRSDAEAPSSDTENDPEPESEPVSEPERLPALPLPNTPRSPLRDWRFFGASLLGSVPVDRTDIYGPTLGMLFTGSLGRGALGVALSAGVTLPTSLQFPDTTVDAVRLPLELTAAFRFGRDPWLFSSEAGLAVDIWRFQGIAPDADEQWRLMPGAVIKISSGYLGWGRVGPLVALSASAFPQEHRFILGPLGEVGQSNQLWIGAQVGVLWDSR